MRLKRRLLAPWTAMLLASPASTLGAAVLPSNEFIESSVSFGGRDVANIPPSAASLPSSHRKRSAHPQLQYPNPIMPPQSVSMPARKDTQCKNCPYASCLNSAIITSGWELGFACWTSGEAFGNDRLWLRTQYGPRIGDYCYVLPSDFRDTTGSGVDFRTRLPYCGQRSELNFFLPSAQVTTQLRTECSLCPFRDCEGAFFYQAGSTLEVNCVYTDGWLQFSPQWENGTAKYYRTKDSCYVSLSTISQPPQLSTPGATLQTDMLPLCGPVPHLKSESDGGGGLPAAPAPQGGAGQPPAQSLPGYQPWSLPPAPSPTQQNAPWALPPAPAPPKNPTPLPQGQNSPSPWSLPPAPAPPKITGPNPNPQSQPLPYKPPAQQLPAPPQPQIVYTPWSLPPPPKPASRQNRNSGVAI